MTAGPIRQRLHWLAQHGVVRGAAMVGARRGEPQARLIADPAVRADPFPFYDEVRTHGRLLRGPASYLTVDHAVAHEVLRSDDFRVVALGSEVPGPLGWLERRTRDDQVHPLRPPSLLAVDPPEHTRYRKTVSSMFTPKAVAALRERVQHTANALLGELAADSGVVDVVPRYCSRLPVAIISDILGVPERDRAWVLEFGELAAPSLDFGLPWRQYRRVQRGIAGFNDWLAGHLDRLRRSPGDDAMSELIRAAESGDPDTRLDERELQAVAGLVLAAGFETTVNLLSNGIALLLDASEHRQTLRQSPQLWPNAVEEILRLDSPVQLTARVAGTDTEAAGVVIRRGELVVIALAAANRDPAVFADPHRFDVERDGANRHMAFSSGRHYCLGAALARAEGEVGLRTFFDRFPDARAAGAGTRRDTQVLRGWSTLPVSLG